MNLEYSLWLENENTMKIKNKVVWIILALLLVSIISLDIRLNLYGASFINYNISGFPEGVNCDYNSYYGFKIKENNIVNILSNQSNVDQRKVDEILSYGIDDHVVYANFVSLHDTLTVQFIFNENSDDVVYEEKLLLKAKNDKEFVKINKAEIRSLSIVQTVLIIVFLILLFVVSRLKIRQD